jgi:hypothetical protein
VRVNTPRVLFAKVSDGSVTSDEARSLRQRKTGAVARARDADELDSI